MSNDITDAFLLGGISGACLGFIAGYILAHLELKRPLFTGIVAIALAGSVGAWRAQAQDVPHAGIPAGGCSMPCSPDPNEANITLGKVRELQIALSSIERREGTCHGKDGDQPCSVPVPTCLGDVKAPCIPLGISSAIADDLASLSTHWQFYQAQAHKLIGEASGGSGYVAPGSKEETVANYRLFDLNGQHVTVRMRRIDVNGLEASGVQLPPSIKAVLAPISR